MRAVNPISYALKQVYFKIPREVLEKVFLSNIEHRMLQPTSLDVEIRRLVLDERVLVDCDLHGGTEAWVPLTGLPREIIDPFTWIYRIPKKMTQGRSITRVLSIGYGDGIPIGTGYTTPVRSNALMDTAAGLINSVSPIPQISTAEIQLVGENTVMITNALTLPITAVLRCWLENDVNFNHLQRTAYKDFADGVVLAVKAYIYVNAQIPMDRGFIYAGNELGRFKEVVDSYSDCDEQYETWFDETWKKVSLMNDPVAHKRYLNAIMGGLN